MDELEKYRKALDARDAARLTELLSEGDRIKRADVAAADAENDRARKGER